MLFCNQRRFLSDGSIYTVLEKAIEPAVGTHGAMMFKAEETASTDILRQKHENPFERK